jgi:hypothetical protein
VNREDNVVFDAPLRTTEGLHFTVQVTNKNSGNGITYFSGKISKEFARVYQMEAGHLNYFTKDEGGSLMVHSRHPVGNPKRKV